MDEMSVILFLPLESQWPLVFLPLDPGGSHSGILAFTIFKGVLRPFLRLQGASFRSRRSTGPMGTATSARLPVSIPREISSQSDTAPVSVLQAPCVSLNSSVHFSRRPCLIMQTWLVSDRLYSIGPGVAMSHSLSAPAASQTVINPLLDLRFLGLC